MRTTIDKFGRFVIPKALRDKIGLRPGDEIEIEEQGQKIIIKKVEHESSLRFEEGVLVFTGMATGDLLESVRRHRDH